MAQINPDIAEAITREMGEAMDHDAYTASRFRVIAVDSESVRCVVSNRFWALWIGSVWKELILAAARRAGATATGLRMAVMAGGEHD